MSNTHHVECSCDLCFPTDHFGWTSCTCAICDPDGHGNNLWEQYLNIRRAEEDARHAILCECEFEFCECDKYPHDLDDRHWSGCECIDFAILDCCCPICDQNAFDKIIHIWECDNPWGESIECVSNITIFRDARVGFTVHAENMIITAISLADARAAANEILDRKKIRPTGGTKSQL